MEIQLMIEWVKGASRLQNISLSPVLDQILSLMGYFRDISFNHVHREHNMLPDSLSKQALDCQIGMLDLVENREDEDHPSESRSILTELCFYQNSYIFYHG
jgi:hypothetical protein